METDTLDLIRNKDTSNTEISLIIIVIRLIELVSWYFERFLSYFQILFMGLTRVLVPCKPKYIYASQTLVHR